MGKKLQFLAQTMLLVFLPAFVMRPVMVTVENNLSVPGHCSTTQAFCDSHADLSAGHATFRSIARENTPQMPVVSSCYTKTILASTEGRDLQFTSKSISFSPQSFHVLRI